MAKSPLKPGVRPGFQPKLTNKERPSERTVFPMSALCARSFSRPAGRDYFFVLVDFPSREIGKIKRGFRTLRSPASLRGWIAPGRRPGPILACGRDWCGAIRFSAKKKQHGVPCCAKQSKSKYYFFLRTKNQNRTIRVKSIPRHKYGTNGRFAADTRKSAACA